jgi:hypothetical protein
MANEKLKALSGVLPGFSATGSLALIIAVLLNYIGGIDFYRQRALLVNVSPGATFRWERAPSLRAPSVAAVQF